MQITSSLYGLGAALATRGAVAADSPSSGAGFASLLLQRNQATPAPVATVAPAPAVPPQPRTTVPVAAQAPIPKPPPSGPAPAPPRTQPHTPAATQATPKADTADKPEEAASPADGATDPAAMASTAAEGVADSQAASSAAARVQLRNKLRGADSASSAGDASADKADAAASDPLATTAAMEKTKDARGHDGSAADPALNPLAVNTSPPAPLPAARSDDTATGTAGKGSDPAANDKSRTIAEAAAAKRDAALQAAATDPATAARPDAGTHPIDSAFTTLLAEQHAESTPNSRAAAVDSAAPVGVNASAFGPAPATGTAAPQAVEVPTPVNAPDFAQQLGVQVSVLAKDGIQHAELHLNPADMGPVSVQITLDGTQARVDFGAEVAATRQAIETGLPALASALADAGFTLAGGGVSQHAGGSRGDGSGSSAGSGNGGRRAASVDAADTASAGASRVLRRTVSAGGVDLYA